MDALFELLELCELLLSSEPLLELLLELSWVELLSDDFDVLFELSLLFFGPQSSAAADGMNDKVTATVVAPAITAVFTGLRNVFLLSGDEHAQPYR